MSNRSSKSEPVCESYGAYDMISKIFICSAMIILILGVKLMFDHIKQGINVLTS